MKYLTFKNIMRGNSSKKEWSMRKCYINFDSVLCDKMSFTFSANSGDRKVFYFFDSFIQERTVIKLYNDIRAFIFMS